MVEGGPPVPSVEQVSAEEHARIMALLEPLLKDKADWEAQFTEQEKSTGAQFEMKLKEDPQELMAFMAEIQETFQSCDADGDGLLVRDEFKNFVHRMNENGVGRGLKHRETTDEFIDMVYPAFNGFNQETTGVSKGEIMMVLDLLNK